MFLKVILLICFSITWQIQVGCFCWALPRFGVASLCLSCGETQIWLGDLRVALVLVFGVSCLLVLFELICHFHGPYVSLYTQIFTAYAIVRTEPSAISATPEEKKHFQVPWSVLDTQTVASSCGVPIACFTGSRSALADALTNSHHFSSLCAKVLKHRMEKTTGLLYLKSR